MVAADHAGQAAAAARRGDRRGQLAAELAHGELLAPLARGRLEDRAKGRSHTALAEALREQRCQHRGRLGAAGIGAAKAPRRTDYLNLSLHRDILSLKKTTPPTRTGATPQWSNGGVRIERTSRRPA